MLAALARGALVEQLDAAVQRFRASWLVIVKDKVLATHGTVKVRSLDRRQRTEADIPRADVARFFAGLGDARPRRRQ